MQTIEHRASYQPPPVDAVPHAVSAMGSQPNMSAIDPRMRAAAFALLACAVVLLVGFFSRAWFSSGVGLLGVDTRSWFDVAGAPLALKLFATAGILGIAGAIAFLIHAAVVLFKHQPQSVMMVPLNASLGIAAFGCTSLFLYLTFGDLSLSPRYAGILTLAAIIGASIVIGKIVRPLARANR